MSNASTPEMESCTAQSAYRPGDEPIRGYRLHSPLGRGGFGEVWKCVAPGGLLKAMKIITRLHSLEDDHAACVESEAISRVKDIRHPYLVNLERVDASASELIIVMDLAESNLQSEFERYRSLGYVGIPEDELIHYLLEAAEALDVLNFQHGLQHLDVKPANLLIRNRHVMLADFSLVRHVASEAEPRRQPLPYCFTPRYAAPELLQGDVSRFSDQYSLAFVYQELLTGSAPFEGGLLKRLISNPGNGGLSEGDREVLLRALSSRPQERFASCLDFVRALIAAKGTKSESHYSRVLNFSSLMVPKPPSRPPETDEADFSQYEYVEWAEPSPASKSFGQTPTPSSIKGISTDTPTLIRRSQIAPRLDALAQVQASTGTLGERTKRPGMIYPLTIHLSDLKWKTAAEAEVAPPVDDFVDRLVAAVTELGRLPGDRRTSSTTAISVIEDSFMTAITSNEGLQAGFDEILFRCCAEEIQRSQNGIAFAVEGSLPIWEMFSSKQRVLKISIEVSQSRESGLSKVSVRIEPLARSGSSLHPRMIDIRGQIQDCVREVLREVPERRRGERAACNFSVELFPITGEWRFGPSIPARATNVSAKGIGLIVQVPPAAQRFYLRPASPNPLSSFAILTEVVRHAPCPDGGHNWGAALGVL